MSIGKNITITQTAVNIPYLISPRRNVNMTTEDALIQATRLTRFYIVLYPIFYHHWIVLVWSFDSGIIQLS